MRIGLSEQVWIDYRPASYGSRALAYIIDFLLRWTLVLGVLIFLLVVRKILDDGAGVGLMSWILPQLKVKGSYVLAALTIFIFLIEWSYPIYYEVLRDGVSPGKRMFGLRVVNSAGLPISFTTSVIRTVLLVVDLIPGSGFVALVSMLVTKQSQRVGDLVAGTMVVYDAEASQKSEIKWNAGDTEVYLIPLELYKVLENYLQRRNEISSNYKAQAQEKLIVALGKVVSAAPPLMVHARDQWLEAVFVRSHPTKMSYGNTGQASAAEWSKIRRELDSTEQKLRSLDDSRDQISEAELGLCAQAFQQLCQRYAYLSTFFPDTREAVSASRLVRYGRRLIYGRRLESVQGNIEPFLKRVPKAYGIVKNYCLFAAGVAIASALITASLVILNPNLGWHMLSEKAANDLVNGKMWTEQIRGIGSLASSKIMTNNITVSLSAFALGVAGGFGTIIILIFNGAILGGLFAVLAQYHMAHRLFNFVVAHGFLELSIIAVSAGCGLAIGDAFLNPGSLTRLKSIQTRAKPAIDVVIFSAFCLIPAGIVEGYISPYDEIPLGAKLTLGLTLAAVYWTFLIRGSLVGFGSLKSKVKIQNSKNV